MPYNMQHISYFYRSALEQDLHGTAMCLWLYLYDTMDRQHNFTGVPLESKSLMDALGLSKTTFLRARQTLAERGFLCLQRLGHTVYYTLLVNHAPGTETLLTDEAISEQPCTPLKDDATEQAEWENLQKEETKLESSLADGCLTSEPGQPPAQENSEPKNLEQQNMEQQNMEQENLMINHAYYPLVREFCRNQDSTLCLTLLRWCAMREKNHWALSKWGLEALLQKLEALAEAEVGMPNARGHTKESRAAVDTTMVLIAEQSIAHSWKGFFPLKKEKQNPYYYRKKGGNSRETQTLETTGAGA